MQPLRRTCQLKSRATIQNVILYNLVGKKKSTIPSQSLFLVHQGS